MSQLQACGRQHEKCHKSFGNGSLIASVGSGSIGVPSIIFALNVPGLALSGHKVNSVCKETDG